MPPLKTYDLFISHAWKYGADYDRLTDLLSNANNFKYRNYSAPKHKPLFDPDSPVKKLALQTAIVNKIKPVNAVLVISGMYYNYREWMQFEIDTALEYSKPIISIKPYGNLLTPQAIYNISTIDVNWNTSSIVEAIRHYSI